MTHYDMPDQIEAGFSPDGERWQNQSDLKWLDLNDGRTKYIRAAVVDTLLAERDARIAELEADCIGYRHVAETQAEYSLTLEKRIAELEATKMQISAIGGGGDTEMTQRIEFVGTPSGDWECFCWAVNADTFKRIAGREPADYNKSEFYEDSYKLYPEDLWERTDDPSNKKFTVIIEPME